MKDTIKLGVILFIITAICAGLLGLVNSITSPIIKEKKEVAKQEAMRMLIKEAEEFEPVLEIKQDEVQELYIARANGEYLGAVAKVSPEGYGGAIELLVGVNNEGCVTGIQVLSHAETPGLGANILKESFNGQFIGKKGVIEVVKGSAKEGEISAITGATITSRAVTQGVNQAVNYIINNQDKFKGGEK